MISSLIAKIKTKLLSGEPVQQLVVGIDLSHDYVRTVQLQKNKDIWSLTKLASKAINSHSQDPSSKQEEIVHLLKTIRLEQKFETTNAAVCLPVNSAIVQVIQIPYLAETELYAAIENGSLWENSISLPDELSAYSIFWQVIKQDPEKNLMSLLFVASRIDEIEKYCDIVRKAGFEPLVVDVRCFALRNILKTYSEEESSKLNVFLELSGDENYIVFVNEDLPFIYDIFISETDAHALKNNIKEPMPEIFTRLGAQIRSSVSTFLKQSGAPGLEKINLISSLHHFDTVLEGIKKEVVEFKIEPVSPFSHVVIPSQLRQRVDSEKNITSLPVSTGLATRQLDVFGYYKFVTAVSNINLLPNREEIIKKEQEKAETSGTMRKIAIGTSAIMVTLLVLYYYLCSTFPSNSDNEQLISQISTAQSEVSKLKSDYELSKKWAEGSGKSNQNLIDISYLQEMPSGVYVIEVIQNRKGTSQITLKTLNPDLPSQVSNFMSKRFKNVKLAAVESSKDDAYQTFKIIYQVD